LLKDIHPDYSYPSYFTSNNGIEYFQADNSTDGAELWISDGTELGTMMLKDIAVGIDGSYPENLTKVGNKVFFAATTVSEGKELWISDGTMAGTELVKDIFTGIDGSNPQVLTDVNGTLFFTCYDPISDIELWKSDGTLAGTQMVKDINPSGASNPSNMLNVGGILYFFADDGVNGVELWRSDGTSSGTYMVKDITIGVDPTALCKLYSISNFIYFTVDSKLWVSDGTEIGTKKVDSQPEGLTIGTEMTTYNNKLYFTAELERDRESWVYTPSSQTIWNGTAWSNGVPNQNLDAIIAGNYILGLNIPGSNIDCKSLTIQNGYSVTVLSNRCLKVINTLTNNGTIVMKFNSSLIENGLINNGLCKYELDLTSGVWHLFGTPFSTSFNVGNYFTGDWFYEYDESQTSQNSAWIPIISTSFAVNNSKGYLIKAQNTATKTLVGTFKTGNHSFASLPVNYQGYSLVANPYPSAIDWNSSGFTKNNINNTIWVWNNTVYATFDGFVGVNGGSRYIAPLQGFFVQANVAGATVDMSNSVRTCVACNYLKSGETTTTNLLLLKAQGNNLSDEIALYQSSENNTSYKMKAGGDVPQIYFTDQAKEFAIYKSQNFSGKIIPVSFECTKSGVYTIVSNLSQFDANLPVFIQDKLLNTYTNLRNVSSYQFAYTKGESNDRFNLIFSDLTNQKNETSVKNALKIYSYQNKVVVETTSFQDKIFVFDISGKLILQKSIEATKTELLLSQPGVYFVRVGSTVKKVEIFIN